MSEEQARRALQPLSLDEAAAAGLIAVSAGAVRALLDLRPYAEAGGPPWWVVSDFGSDARPGPLAVDHVLGVGAASLTLAQATVRAPVGRALDVGTGCGIQALHLSRHAGRVAATDVSRRALRLAATTAALSGVQWDLREGSLLDPVANERFDLVVANPPFVVSPGLRPGAGGYDYRDSGLAGDGVCRALLSTLPSVLAPGGTAQLLANWIIPERGTWSERLEQWLDGRGCDAWIWQREVAEAGEYVALWLRDAGEVPGSERWSRRYDAWLDWFEQQGVVAIGLGLVTLWQTDAPAQIVCEDVPQPVEAPAGAHLPGWLVRRRWLAATPAGRLPATRLRLAEGVVLTRHAVAGDGGWRTTQAQLRQTRGLRWELEVDDAVAALLAGCDGTTPLSVALAVLAGSVGAPVEAVGSALEPVLRDLVGRGFLEPVGPVERR